MGPSCPPGERWGFGRDRRCLCGCRQLGVKEDERAVLLPLPSHSACEALELALLLLRNGRSARLLVPGLPFPSVRQPTTWKCHWLPLSKAVRAPCGSSSLGTEWPGLPALPLRPTLTAIAALPPPGLAHTQLPLTSAVAPAALPCPCALSGRPTPPSARTGRGPACTDPASCTDPPRGAAQTTNGAPQTDTPGHVGARGRAGAARGQFQARAGISA